jgi:hypothetical protein
MLNLIPPIPEEVVAKEASKTMRSSMHSEGDLKVYADQFSQSGMLNPLRWYRNVEANWKWR